jgi:hypothetical protein
MKEVKIDVTYTSPVVHIALDTDDKKVLTSLFHRLNIGRNRMANARKRIRDADGTFQAIGPRYADEYGIVKDDLDAKGTPLEDIANRLEEVLLEMDD